MTTRFTLWIMIIAATAITVINACRKSDSRRYDRPTPYSLNIPESFPAPVYSFENNPLTEEGFALGKKLFYESRLSKFNDVSCGGCHQQVAAFTSFDHDLGHGTNRQHTTRNVPALFNMIWHPSMQWDGSVDNLEEQVLTCMMAPEKMAENALSVIDKLKGEEEYKQLFGAAFGVEEMTGDKIAKALTQFVASLVSGHSRYDKIKKGEGSFTASEQEGYQIFQQFCQSCHAEPLFSDFTLRNSGLIQNPHHADLGRMEVTGSPADSLKFKVPSLRNITLTGYYGHDGRFSDLSQMIDHYSSGVQSGPTLDPLLENGITLTDLEKFYLREFLFTLADTTLTGNQRFSR